MAKSPGRASIDWEEAFAFYASLSPVERSYQAVADAFGVSARTVETHGRKEHWKARLHGIAEQAAAQADAALAQARVDELQKVRRLIDASFIAYAERLREGQMRMSTADLERLNRLSLALIDEITHPRTNPQREPTGQPERTPAHTAAVVAALAEAGALEALGLTVRVPDVSEEGAST